MSVGGVNERRVFRCHRQETHERPSIGAPSSFATPGMRRAILVSEGVKQHVSACSTIVTKGTFTG